MPEPAPMPEVPESIGPYRILSKVGEGGMGVVYKAQDQRLERIVALKVIREFDSDASRRSRFWKEARAAAQVAHPNACRIYDIAEDQDRLVLVMEFIEGESLAKRLERGSLPVQEAAQTALAILSALEAFHKIGIVHRDLKPDNTVLSASGTKLLDFGIAKHIPVNSPQETVATLRDATIPGVFLGTPRYASPEQFRGQPVEARSDLFSLGVIFFEMLTGQPPFPGDSFGGIAHSVLEGSPPALSGSPVFLWPSAPTGRTIHFLNIMLASIYPGKPQEAITREQAVIAYTVTAAPAQFAEKDKGSLGPGKFADLAVLSLDFFAVPPPELPKTVSLLTLVGGKIVYDAGAVKIQ